MKAATSLGNFVASTPTSLDVPKEFSTPATIFSVAVSVFQDAKVVVTSHENSL
jgi:hypothetical protein